MRGAHDKTYNKLTMNNYIPYEINKISRNYFLKKIVACKP